ncbi:hypothetical protein JW979_11315, partial [bacterium]|nr:hypothetical protein [candidate division CSSED10-310 bacterium]
IDVENIEGYEVRFKIHAGTDTAEWAYDRPDLAGKIQHKKAPVAMSKKVTDISGVTFLSHTYRLTHHFAPSLTPYNIKISFLLTDEQFKDVKLTIYTIIFQ